MSTAMAKNNEQSERLLYKALERLMGPIARWVIRHGVPYRTVTALWRRALVREAMDQVANHPSGAPNISKIALKTGLARRDAQTTYQHLAAEFEPWSKADGQRDRRHVTPPRPRLETILHTWHNKQPWCSTRGQPRHLTRQEFDTLVREAAHPDFPTSTALSELIDNEAVKETKGGKLQAVARTLVVRRFNEEMVEHGIRALERHTDTVLHNWDVGAEESEDPENRVAEAGKKRFEQGIWTREVPADHIPVLEDELYRELNKVYERFERLIKKHEDRYNGDITESPVTVGLGLFQFQAANPDYKGHGGEK